MNEASSFSHSIQPSFVRRAGDGRTPREGFNAEPAGTAEGFATSAISVVSALNTPRVLLAQRRSERDLRRELDQPARQNGLRLQPGAVWHECIVIRQHRAGVQRVVKVGADERSRTAEPQHLADAEIELVESVTVHLARSEDVDRHVGGVARRISAKSLSDGCARDGPIRRQQRPGLALEDAAELDVDLWNHIVGERPELRQPAVVHLAVWIGGVHRRCVDARESLYEVDAELGKISAHLAVVTGALPCARAALERPAVSESHIEGYVFPVEVVLPVA